MPPPHTVRFNGSHRQCCRKPQRIHAPPFAENGRLLDSQGRITLDTPEALRALENYRETYSYSDRTIYDFWKNALEGFADGTAAMTVVFINYASHILNSQMSRIAGKLGFAPVPGGKPLLGGGVIGIAQSCTCPAAACKFWVAVCRLGGTGLHDAGRPVSLPFRIQQPRYQRAIPLALHCAKELSHSAAPQQQHLLPELQRAATRDHSGGPCPAGSFGGMFPRRSAEAGPRGLQSLFSAMVKRPNCKRQIVEDEFIRAGRDVSPAGPGDSAVVCRTGDRAAG